MSDPAFTNVGPEAEIYGAYRVLRLLGEGASGRVFLAERIDFAQRVALKVFRSGFLTAGLSGAGSTAEPHLLASLDHRHIVRVLQGGATPAGVRYLAMEYIEGEDIVTFCDTHRLSAAVRVRLLLQVLEAVEHAHRHLVIHGDLKPANILVTAADGAEPQARLLDFGSALPLSGEHTTSGHTPTFASPEQRAGARTTAASDIYSLGLLARLLLTGTPSASPLSTGQRRDLDAILRKALEGAPEDRYGTAEAMAADLRAFAEGRTPAVRQASLPERLRKWTLRHKLGAAMGAVLACVLLFSAVGVAVKAAQARRSRREAEARLRELVQLTGTLQSELYSSVHALPNAGASEKLLTDSAAATLDRLAAANPTDPTGPTDPTLRAELAAQYAQLARLELDQAHAAGAGSLSALAAQHLRRSLALTAENDPQRAERARMLTTATERVLSPSDK